MNLFKWFSLLSRQQRIWMLCTFMIMAAIIVIGISIDSATEITISDRFSVDMSMKQIAPKLGVTPKALAREFGLPINVSKRKPLYSFAVTEEDLQRVVQHLRSHSDGTIKYYVYLALVLWSLIFLVKLGRPSESSVKNRKNWYPRSPYVITLFFAVIFAGFVLGKSPNPMEGIVKVVKSMAGLYPDPYIKFMVFVFFIILAIVGNKLICGWACPFGALQELIYSLPILKKIRKKKLPFVWTNSIRASLFVIMLLFLFGSIGRRKGFVVYHYINPFNLFNWDFETISITLTVVAVLAVSFIVYRPFCQMVCPFGLVSWIAERFSVFRVVIDKDKCVQGKACINACPLETTKGLLEDNILPADCYSCMRCLNVCPIDAINYEFFLKKIKRKKFKNERSNNIKAEHT